MSILSISWVRNEADIIEDFVRHHADIIDRMVIIDNASTDETPLILQRLAEEGLPIDLRYDDSPVHRQGKALTDVMHNLPHSALPDWILPLDADEFLLNDLGSIQESIATLSPDHVALLPWRTYVPTPNDNVGELCTTARIQNRREWESPQFHKILIPRRYHSAAYHIPTGSHQLKGDDTILMCPSPHLALAHFPVRHPEQIVRKIVESWERYQADDTRLSGEGFHWEQLYAELKNGPLPTRERLKDIALFYAANSKEDNSIVYDPL